MIHKVRDAFLSLIYPEHCRICGGEVADRNDGVVCSECWKNAELYTGLETKCEKCGLLLGSGDSLFVTFCRSCDGHSYDSARAVGTYKAGLAASVLQLKVEPFIPDRIAARLGLVFEEYFAADTTLIVPVPFSARRLKERGFNQAGVIARSISKSSGVPVDDLSLIRTRHTPMHRAAMDRKAREKTVEDAFEVRRPKLIAGQDITLVDDIFTSGATAHHCAAKLKESGAAKVNVLTIAHAALRVR